MFEHEWIWFVEEFETLQGEHKESVAADDDGTNGSCKTEDIAVSLEHVEDAVEEHAKGVDQSIGEVG